MIGCVTVDERERVRAVRVEVARLITLPFRVKLTDWEYRMRNHLLLEHVKTLPLADRETFDAYLEGPHKDMDWSIVDDAGIEGIIRSAVLGTCETFAGKLSATEDDLTQSARIILAERARFARSLRARGEQLLREWIVQRLTDLIRYEHTYTSLDWLEEEAGQ